MTTIISNPQEPNYDQRKAVKEFEETKLGVKGLVDAGVTNIPRIFQHPPENLIPKSNQSQDSDLIPVIDLLSTPREELVEKVREASSKFGFFQMVNHGVPVALLDCVIDVMKAFHDQPAEERMKHYSRDPKSVYNYFSNIDLFASKAASWRDTLLLRLALNLEDIPAICRDEVKEWDKEMKQLGEILLGLFSEGLGVNVDRLKKLSCLERRTMVGHYYPYCPQPEKTVGIASHSDPGVFTVLLQDQVGGLHTMTNGLK